MRGTSKRATHLSLSSTVPTIGNGLGHGSDSDDPLSAGKGVFNVAFELLRMYDTARGERFRAFVHEKHSPEPFLCWERLEALVRQVRNDTLEADGSRADKVISVVSDFVTDGGPLQLTISLDTKEKCEALVAKIKQDPDFWDARPILTLQREVEFLMQIDLREFSDANPWTDEDHVHGPPPAIMELIKIPVSEMTPSRQDKEIKASARSGSAIGRARTLLGKSAMRMHSKASKDSSTFVRAEKERVEVHVSIVGDVLLLQSAVEDADTRELNLRHCSLKGWPEHGKFELVHLRDSDPFVYLFSAPDAQRWIDSLSLIHARLVRLSKRIAEKRDRILAQPVEVPARLRAYIEHAPGVSAAVPKIFGRNPRNNSALRKAETARGELGKRKKSAATSGNLPASVSSVELDDAKYQRKKSAAATGDVPANVSALMGPVGYMSIPMENPEVINYSDLPDHYADKPKPPVISAPSAAPYKGFSRPGLDASPAVMYASTGSLSSLSTQSSSSQLHDAGYKTLPTRSPIALSSSSSDDESASLELTEDDKEGLGDFNSVFQRCVASLRAASHAIGDEQTEQLKMESYMQLIGVAEDFVRSAVRYGQIIISEVYLKRSRQTIKQHEGMGGIIGGEKFVVHNILFKFAVDSSGIFGKNDEMAAKVAGLELAYVSTDTPDLCFPLMALIDYKGFRLVASSLLPLGPGSLVYGSKDAAMTVLNTNPALAARVEEASAKLNLKKHEAGRQRVVMASAVDVEGHVGIDGRYYMLDFSRVFPPVRPDRTVDGAHLVQAFRPEFVKGFPYFPLCSDGYSQFTAGLPDMREHMEEIDAATNELLNVTLSNFVAELLARIEEEVSVTGSLSSFSLTQFLHSHGINVRYLGEVVKKIGRHAYSYLVLAEMVARVVKRGYRRTLREKMCELRVSIDKPYRFAARDFLNMVFGESPESDTYWQIEVPRVLDQQFKLRPGNWAGFPKSLKRDLLELSHIASIPFNARFYIYRRVQAAIGFRIAPSLEELLETQPRVYKQKYVFDDVDVEDVGLRVKFLDVISNAQGFVFTRRAKENQEAGFTQAAKTLYQRAYSGYQDALNASPNDPRLLSNCAGVLTELYRMSLLENPPEVAQPPPRPADPSPRPQRRPSLSLDPPSSPRQRRPSLTDSTAPLMSSESSTPRGVEASRPLQLRVEAIHYYKRAIQANRKLPSSFSAYACFLAELGLDNEAEAHFIEALEREPNSVHALQSYAKLLERLGSNTFAATFRERAALVDSMTKDLMEARAQSEGLYIRLAPSTSYVHIEPDSSYFESEDSRKK